MDVQQAGVLPTKRAENSSGRRPQVRTTLPSLQRVRSPLTVLPAALLVLLAGCGSVPDSGADPRPIATASPTTSAVPSSAAPTATVTPPTGSSPSLRPRTSAPRRPVAGNPAGHAAVPASGRPVDTSRPDRVVGTGTAASCTSAAVVAAVAAGGVITFSCGPSPVTIAMDRTALVDNRSARVVLDGGGLVTLSGGGSRRILYQNTCDQARVWTTSHCQDQESPQLVLQDITFANGNSTGDATDGGGGGAVFVRGGRLTVTGVRFTGNRCDPGGPDLGGAALRVLDQYQHQPAVVSGSTFEGGRCSNGGALSSIGVSWTVRNSVFRTNEAVGSGANPARPGTPGGGNGGAICTDGNGYVVDIAGTLIEDNHAREGGGGIFFVSNDRSGQLRVGASTTLARNRSDGFETAGRPGIFVLDSTTG